MTNANRGSDNICHYVGWSWKDNRPDIRRNQPQRLAYPQGRKASYQCPSLCGNLPLSLNLYKRSRTDLCNVMNIEQVREFALGINPQVTEELFAENWISWRIFGKWFLLMQLDAPEPRVAVKLLPEMSAELRARYDGIRPAYHMNKTHWNDLYLNELPDTLVQELITSSYQLIASKLPKTQQALL